MNIRHTAKLRCIVLGDGIEVDRSDNIDPYLMGAHETTTSIMYNALTMSGGVLWRHPSTGQRFRRVQLRWELMDPADELAEGQLCDCGQCPEEVAS